MCKGNSVEVHRMLKQAPDLPDFNDCGQFRFKMYHSNINKNKEEVYVTPVGLAVNIGDYALLDSLLKFLRNLNSDAGLQSTALNAPILNNKNLR
jgi:hypothetical protein